MNTISGLDIDGANLDFVEDLFAQYCEDPREVSADWRSIFDQLLKDRSTRANGELANGHGVGRECGQRGPSMHLGSMFHLPEVAANVAETSTRMALMQDRVDQLIRSYRMRGHQIAKVDPLARPVPNVPRLSPEHFGFTAEDLGRTFSTQTISGANTMTLGEIVEWMKETYCRSIGVQFMHLDDYEQRLWLQSRMEACRNRLTLTRTEQLRILMRLTDAVVFEEFIQKRFTGKKSFSLEGSETLIPLLELAIEHGGSQGINEVVLGMAHRGRLNVLANIMGKTPQSIFREFKDMDAEKYIGRGDVKYHLGYSSDWQCANGQKVHLSLSFNPSHLEFVNPVVLGRLRAKQDRARDAHHTSKLAILIHGDAAFAGEGVVQETLNMSRLPAYSTGGTLHIIVNNQIGFTTPPEQGRSTPYATDVAKMLDVPIFHVNGEDPEAVAQVVRLALDFRQEFHSDVFIDMYCYRLHGHNEQDEPEFTQPDMYALIRSAENVRDSYLDRLVVQGGVTLDEANHLLEHKKQQLDKAYDEAMSDQYRAGTDAFGGYWRGYQGGSDTETPDITTGVDAEKAKSLLLKLMETPEGFEVHRTIAKSVFAPRKEMATGARSLDWAAGELLAYASLLEQGIPIRMTGQDCERGTFSHRHAVLHDAVTGKTHMPLAFISPNQARMELANSPLSEIGVLGFEYGYSVDAPDALVLWEAQFGDFCNVAQVIIDQFIASGEDKWSRLCGLVMLLPHGYEGQGPEHSSARLERFLTLCAEDNMQVIYPTTPAQIFHALRRQVLRKWRKPLVVMTPKSMLRNPEAVSPLKDFATGSFRRVIADSNVDPGQVRKILLCSGKVYYELMKRRNETEQHDAAIIRLEQIYPISWSELDDALGLYPDDTPAVWVQEEPENMGAWRFLRIKFGERLLGRFPLSCVSRPESSSPATGSFNSHVIEQQRILNEAFEGVPAIR